MRLRLRVVPRAERHIRQASDWWQENRRAARGLFRRELEKAFDLITTHPRIGPRARYVEAPGIRTFHLSRIHYDLYYRIRDDVVEVLALWHSRRGTKPDL